MADEHSRREFLTGALITGTMSAAAVYLMPGGRPEPNIRLNLVTGEDPTGARALLIDMWNNANPRTTVNPIVVTGDTFDQMRTMIGLAQDGTADIINLDTIHLPRFAAMDLITPIELRNVGVFVDNVLRSSEVAEDSSRHWAAPFNADVGMLFARLDRPAVVGAADEPPRMADVLGAPGQFIGQLNAGSSASEEAFVVNVLEQALAGSDTPVLGENGMPVYDLALWQAALAPIRAAVAEKRALRTDTEADSLTVFTSQGLRYMRNWPVKYRELQQARDQAVSESRIRVHPLPFGIVGGQSLALAAQSRHRDRAAELIHFLVDEPAQKVLAAHGLPPTRRAPYSDANLTAFIPHLDLVRGAVEDGRPRPVHPNYEEFSRAVVRHVKVLLDPERGRDLPSQFIDEMRAALQ